MNATDPALAPKPPQTRTSATAQENTQHEISQPPPRRTRGPIISRFKGFDSDSGDDPESGTLQNQESVQQQSAPGHRQSQRTTVCCLNLDIGILNCVNQA